MKHSKSYIMMSITRMALPLILAVGSFMGKANDPQLSGFFWLFAFLWTLTEIFGVFAQDKNEAYVASKDIPTFTFANKVTADDALFELRDLMDTKGKVTVKDLYDVIGFPRDGSIQHGWTDLKNACVRSVGADGWLLYMPPVVEL